MGTLFARSAALWHIAPIVPISAWREEGRMTSLGLRGRRYSGYAVETENDQDVYFVALAASGVNSRCIGRSMFSLPGFLRDVARVGVQDCFVLDMVNN